MHNFKAQSGWMSKGRSDVTWLLNRMDVNSWHVEAKSTQC